MINWRIHHKVQTVSTNLDARAGKHGDVYTADFQTAGRGRLNHSWLSPAKTNLMLSAVLAVEGLTPEEIATLPLVVGLSTQRAVSRILKEYPVETAAHQGHTPHIKWPNDVGLGGRKLAGILCERVNANVIAGIGINVRPQTFAPEIRTRATYLGEVPIEAVRDTLLAELETCYTRWYTQGFTALYDELSAVDYLRGHTVSVRQTDDDAEPIRGLSRGIQDDGSLDVGGTRIYAGEAHVEEIT